MPICRARDAKGLAPFLACLFDKKRAVAKRSLPPFVGINSAARPGAQIKKVSKDINVLQYKEKFRTVIKEYIFIFDISFVYCW